MPKPRALSQATEALLIEDYLTYLAHHPKRLARRYGISVRTVRDYYNRWLRDQARQRARAQARMRHGN